MAQGDSIGRAIPSKNEGGPEITFIRPPVGEVWLITYIWISTYTDLYMVDEINGSEVFFDRASESWGPRENEELKLFLNNNFYIRLEDNRGVYWSGVQFK